MLLAIFGAGASYDSAVLWPPSDHDLPPWVSLSNRNPSLVERGRPPLTDQLFDHSALLVPAATAAVEWVRMNRKGRSVEETLRELQEATAGSPIMQRKLLALRYYLHSVITLVEQEWTKREPTNYDAFLALAEGGRFDRIHLLTFNYDTFLDASLARHLSTQLAPNAFQHQHCSLIHCHGSLNWAYEVLSPLGDLVGKAANEVCDRIVSAEQLELGPLTMLSSNANPPNGFGKLLVPAIAIPVEPKSDFVCPREHIDAIAGDLSRITKVAIVGWKGSEESVRQLLLGLPTSVRGLVVSGSEEESNRIITDLKLPGTFVAATGGFTRSLYLTNEIQRFVES